MIQTKEEFVSQYWNYYLSIENEYLEVEKIIPVDEINGKTFSMSYSKLLLAICNEMDVIFKEFIEFNQWELFSKNNENFGKYRKIITTQLPNFSTEIILYSSTKEMKPFDNWKTDIKLDWWEIFTNIKHHRTSINNGVEYYKLANQKNILNALSGLYQIEMYFYKSILDKNNDTNQLRMPVPQSKRLLIKNWIDNADLIDNRYILYINQNDGCLHFEGEL
jgi:hypothetical protein